MGKKTLYGEMKDCSTNHRSLRSKEFEGNRANPSIIKARLKVLARDPGSHDEGRMFLTDRSLGVRRGRSATPVSLHPLVRWLAAQHLRPWSEIERELQSKLRDMPKGRRRLYIPKFNGHDVCFWDGWSMGKVDGDGVFHSKARMAVQGSRTIRLYEELDEAKLPHLTEGWYIQVLGRKLYWYKRVINNTIAYQDKDGTLKFVKRVSFPQGHELTADEAAHFRTLYPSVQKRLTDRQEAIYKYYTKTAA